MRARARVCVGERDGGCKKGEGGGPSNAKTPNATTLPPPKKQINKSRVFQSFSSVVCWRYLGIKIKKCIRSRWMCISLPWMKNKVGESDRPPLHPFFPFPPYPLDDFAPLVILFVAAGRSMTPAELQKNARGWEGTCGVRFVFMFVFVFVLKTCVRQLMRSGTEGLVRWCDTYPLVRRVGPWCRS